METGRSERSRKQQEQTEGREKQVEGRIRRCGEDVRKREDRGGNRDRGDKPGSEWAETPDASITGTERQLKMITTKHQVNLSNVAD